MKRVLVSLLALVMVSALLLAGCTGGGGNATTSGSGAAATTAAATAATAAATTAAAGESSGGGSEAPMEISIMNWDIADSFSEDGSSDRMLDYFQNKFNISIKPINVSWDDAGEKSTTWAAAGSLPDVIGAQAIPGNAQYYQWINDGVVRALPDDLGPYPEIRQLMEQPEVTAYDVDGKHYFMPRQTYEDASFWSMDRGIINRKDWREKLGFDIPKTQQDFIDMWVAFATGDPNGDGSVTNGMSPNTRWPLYSQTMTTFGYTDGAWTKLPDGSLVIPTMEKSTLPMMSFYRKAYAAGGIAPDFVTALNDEALEWFVAGQLGTLLRQVSPKHYKALHDKWNQAQKDNNFYDCVEILNPPEVPGSKTIRFGEKAYWSETYVNSAVDDAKMARIMEFFDYLYTKEATLMLLYGFEGEDYKLENGDVVLLTEVNPDTGFQKTASEMYRFAYGGMSYLASWPGDLMQYMDPSIPKEIRDYTTMNRDFRIANWEAPAIDYRISAIDIPEKGEMSAIDYGNDWAKFIVDTSTATDEALFDAMYANWEANGYKAAKAGMTAKVAELGY